MTAYHVFVPATLVYYVEADDMDDAVIRLTDAMAGLPIDGVMLKSTETRLSPAHKWDVEHEYEFGGCGCPINPDYGRCACS